MGVCAKESKAQPCNEEHVRAGHPCHVLLGRLRSITHFVRLVEKLANAVAAMVPHGAPPGLQRLVEADAYSFLRVTSEANIPDFDRIFGGYCVGSR